MATAGDRPDAPRDLRKAQADRRPSVASTPEDEAAQPLPLTQALQGDGSWSIAGVVGFSQDVFGRMVIEVNKDGDFETDTVLSVFVPLVELETGEIAPGGIISVKNNKDTLTLTVNGVVPYKGKVAQSHAPELLGGCEGALDEGGNFICVATFPDCSSWTCYKRVIQGVTFCDCLDVK